MMIICAEHNCIRLEFHAMVGTYRKQFVRWTLHSSFLKVHDHKYVRVCVEFFFYFASIHCTVHNPFALPNYTFCIAPLRIDCDFFLYFACWLCNILYIMLSFFCISSASFIWLFAYLKSLSFNWVAIYLWCFVYQTTILSRCAPLYIYPSIYLCIYVSI